MNDYAVSAIATQLNWSVIPYPGIKFSQQPIGRPENATGSFGSVLSKYDWREAPMQSISGSDVSISVETALEYVISQGVKIRDFGKVMAYLRAYSGLAGPLLYALHVTKTILEPVDELELRVYRDYEDTSFSYLFLEIKKERYPEDFFEILEPVRELLWPMLSNIAGDLHVSTDFRTPSHA